jgi:hypothetical protein
VAYMSGLPIFVRNIEACRTQGRPIYTGYFPLNKGSSLENQQGLWISVTEVDRIIGCIKTDGA